MKPNKSRFPWKLFTRIVLIQSTLVLLAVGGSGFVARHFVKKQFLSQMEDQLKNTLVSLSLNTSAILEPTWCVKQAEGTSFRFTVIAEDGRVTCDSRLDPAVMENHYTRPEVQEALRTGWGS